MFESNDYAARNRNDHDFVSDLYWTYLMRAPDQIGWDYWTSVVPTNGRANVRRAFDLSPEFANLVATLTTSGAPSSAVSSLATARVDLFNQSGSGLLARDAEWSLPLLSLPGRAGLDLGLVLSYSSMVWTRSGPSGRPYIYFDEDNGFPSPGFHLGFPTIQERVFDAQVGQNVFVLVTAAGARVELRQTGTSNVYEAADSSYLQLADNGSSLLVRSTDGTQLTYLPFDGEYRCSKIKDRNGNYISVNNDALGHIINITDTLGRTLTFNYDGNANLLSITQAWSGVTPPHIWASFVWSPYTIQPSFSGASVVGAPNGTLMSVITQVELPDNSYFTFEYTNAAQVSMIRRYTSDDVQRAYTAYDYGSPTDDCPRLSQSRVSAENWTGINGVPTEVPTEFGFDGGSAYWMTALDGTVYKEFYGTGWQKRLAARTEVWSGGTLQKWTTMAWTQDDTNLNYQRNPRVTETNVYDVQGNRRRSTTVYAGFTLSGGGSCTLPTDAYEYAADASTVLRRSHTTYNLAAAYTDRRIIGLPEAQYLCDGAQGAVPCNDSSATSLVSKVTLLYDQGSVQNQSSTTQHDDANYGVSVPGRGNLSNIRRHNATNTSEVAESIVQYNTNGSVVSVTDAMEHQNKFSYTDSFSDSSNHNSFAYATTVTVGATVTGGGGFPSYMQYNYDFGAKTRIEGPPPASQSQGLIQILTYDDAARLERTTTANNRAYTRYVYGPNYVTSRGTVNTVADESSTTQVFDGMGRMVVVASNHPGSSGGYSARHTIYDQMGRAIKQSNPAETNGSWVPAGDDAAGWLYTQQTYDWNGRPRITTNPDSTAREASYSGCGCAGGAVVTMTDEVGRRQKVYSDVLGRTARTEVLNWDSSIYATTTSTYDARDQITQVRQYAGAAGTFQDTTMTYDGYGRLKTKHIPEQNTGTATTWDYNSDDTIQKITDARGAAQTLSYNSRHLVTGITYAVPGGSGITVPGAVSFSYDEAGNRTSMSDGTGSLTYQHNTLSQVLSETRQFSGAGAPSSSYVLSYQYNLSAELKKITDSTNATINYNYDAGGRIAGVTGENTLVNNVSQYASNFAYRAWGAVKDKDLDNGVHSHVDYNARLLPTTATLSHLYAGVNNYTGTMSWSYDHYLDGRLKYAHDVADNRFDRYLEYDQVGRLKVAYSGREARGESVTNPADSPFQQNIQYDVWDNQTSKTGRFWRGSQSDSGTYINNRRQYWGYDAEGNLVSGDGKGHTYDAVGKQTQVTSATETVGGSGTGHAVQSGWEIAQTYDASGQVARRVETRRTEEVIGAGPQTNITETVTTNYYLYSSVLGEKVVELNGTGVKTTGYVYANGERLAKQENVNASWAWVKWHHGNADTTSWVETSEGSAERQEMDPTGAEVGTYDPYLNQLNPVYKDIHPLPQMLYLEGGDPFDFSGGYTLDGVPMSRSDINHMFRQGSVMADVYTFRQRWDGDFYRYEQVQHDVISIDRPTPNPHRHHAQLQNPGPTVDGEYKRCRDQVFGKDATSYAGKDIPGQHQTGLMFLAGRANPNDSAMIAAVWANESDFAETPGGDAGPAQLTTWWSRNHPELIQGKAYGNWNGRTDKPFDGNVQDNIETLGNIVRFSVQRYGNYPAVAYWYGPGDPNNPKNAPKNRTNYRDEAMSRYGKYQDFFNCLPHR